MKTEHIVGNIIFHLSNEDLKNGDKVYSISEGKVDKDNYIHNGFSFEENFPCDPHTILNTKHSDYKPYEVHTDYGYGPIESYFKIISADLVDKNIVREKPKMRISDKLILRLAFNYAENFVGAPKAGEELSTEFKRVFEAVKYGINFGLNSELAALNVEYVNKLIDNKDDEN